MEIELKIIPFIFIEMKKILLICFLFSSLGVFSQTTKEEVLSDLNRTGGVYYAYPGPKGKQTPTPKGYEPFYISHFGRHGSRYLISDNDYLRVAKLLSKADEANALTPLGRSLKDRLDTLMIETSGRGGDLSPLGVRQHREIAERMFYNYPQVFNGKDIDVEARSTLVVRCVLSMAAFTERLKELNPALKVTRESSNRYMPYLNYWTDESDKYRTNGEYGKELYRKFKERHTNPERITTSIFSDKDFIEKNVNPSDFMWDLYWLASDAQNVETPISFYDLFTPDELFDLWQVFNYDFYVNCSNYKGNKGIRVANSKPVLRNIIETADSIIESGNNSVSLRFGHDGNIVPLAAIMRLNDCYNSIDEPNKFYEAFSDWKIAPMAANIQMIFFKNKKNPKDIIVKFLLNEEEKTLPISSEIAPYYPWSDVRNFFNTILEAPDEMLTNPNLGVAL